MYKVSKRELCRPSLEEVAEVLQNGLQDLFSSVDVEVIESPNLTKKPFMLASEGLSGKPSLADVGGVPYLVPLARKDKMYSIKEVAKQMNMPNALVIGPGAGPRHHVGVNCEISAPVHDIDKLMPDLELQKISSNLLPNSLLSLIAHTNDSNLLV